jgi:hypothetical protein
MGFLQCFVLLGWQALSCIDPEELTCRPHLWESSERFRRSDVQRTAGVANDDADAPRLASSSPKRAMKRGRVAGRDWLGPAGLTPTTRSPAFSTIVTHPG